MTITNVSGTRCGDSGVLKQRMRLAVSVSHPIQYFAPVYRALAARDDIDLTVIFHCQAGSQETFDTGFGCTVKWDIPLLDGYKHCFLSSRKRTGGLRLKILHTLVKLRPDILIIHGYSAPTSLVALGLSRLLGTKTLLRGDTRLPGHHKTQPYLARLAKARTLRAFDGCLSIGSLNRDYYLHYGVEARNIFHAPFCVDNARFKTAIIDRPRLRNAKRHALGVEDKGLVVLFASKLLRRKRPADLLSAFANLAPRYPSLYLVIAGAGEESHACEESVRAAGLVQRVKFLGFVNQSQLPRLYAASDIFVLPSEDEPWGLVINEAMAAGLPVIVSDDVGAAADLVQDRNTGIVYPMGDIAALTGSLVLLIENANLRANIASRASALIASWDVDACVSAIADAAHQLHHGVANQSQAVSVAG